MFAGAKYKELLQEAEAAAEVRTMLLLLLLLVLLLMLMLKLCCWRQSAGATECNLCALITISLLPCSSCNGWD